MKRGLLVLCLIATAAHAQSAGRAYSYSSMKYLADADDMVGWDISIVTGREGFDGVLYCGATDVQGPVRFHINAVTGKQVTRPENAVCGAVLTLDFRAGALYIQPNEGSVDRVPRHTNFLSEDKFR